MVGVCGYWRLTSFHWHLTSFRLVQTTPQINNNINIINTTIDNNIKYSFSFLNYLKNLASVYCKSKHPVFKWVNYLLDLKHFKNLHKDWRSQDKISKSSTLYVLMEKKKSCKAQKTYTKEHCLATKGPPIIRVTLDKEKKYIYERKK